MKYYVLNFKQTLALVLLIILSGNLSSQTSEQARSFVNRSHIAIAKVQKEMYKSGKNDFDAEIKKAIKYQVIALNLYKNNNFKDAVGYSYKSRSQCIELCNKMSISEGTWYSLNDDEKTYCNASQYSNIILKPDLLDASETKKIEDVDILNVQKFREIELSVK